MPSVDGGPDATGRSRRPSTAPGCFGVTESPDERPVTRRCTHGTRNSRVHRALAAHCSRRPRVGSGPTVTGSRPCSTPMASRTACGHVGVAVAVEVHPVGVHDAADLDVAHPPHVDDGRAVAVGDLADPLVEDRHPPAHGAVDAAPARVEDREHHHARPGRGQPGDRVVVRPGEGVEVDAGPQHVVAAAVDRHQVGLERDGGVELLVDDRGRACGRGWRGWRSRSRRSAARGPRRRGRPSRAGRWGGRGRGRRRPR